MWNPFQSEMTGADPSAPAEPIRTDWHFSCALLTDTGCQRTANEDTSRLIQSPSDQQTDHLLAVIADGMGGHNAGDVASQLAVDTVCRAYFNQPSAPPFEETTQRRLSHCLDGANLAIFQLAEARGHLNGMGTTCTALAICNGLAYVSHVGDSRLYLMRDTRLKQMTEDHSLVMELVRQGIINLEQAREHPSRNVLHRALGRRATVELYEWPEGLVIQAGDRFLLCSDGLSGVLPETTIRKVLLDYEPGPACAKLIELTRRAGAPDNVTVVLVRVEGDAAAGVSALPETREMQATGEWLAQPEESIGLQPGENREGQAP